jgi:hypothetical protein
LLSRRFERAGMTRVPFLSAMAMMGAVYFELAGEPLPAGDDRHNAAAGYLMVCAG